MEPNTVFATRQGDLGGQKIAMGIDPMATAHLMSVLTNLYSDPELAVIREISTNGLDSHIAAGQTRPIEVTLPSQFTPFFKVRDFGLGMSVTDIENVYSQYGASTKRETNTQVGMLGLGCKAPLTYTNQFTVVAIKGGVKTTVSVGRDEEGQGVMEIVDTCSTDEPNGVEVVVPVKLRNTFDQTAKNFFRFWEPGTVLVNGSEPARIEGKQVADGMLMVRGLNTDFIVMGSVAYPLEDGKKIYTDYHSAFGVVAFVEMGAVNFVPAREALHYTKRTNDEIARLQKVFSDSLTNSIQSEIDAASTHGVALKRFLEWNKTLGYNNIMRKITYKGEAIPTRFDGWFRVYYPNYYRYQVRRESSITQDTLSKGVVVVGYDNDKVHTVHRRKIKKWAEDNSITANLFVLCKEQPGQPWLESTVVEWEEINKVKLGNSSGTKVVRSGYHVPVLQGCSVTEVDASTLDVKKPMVYISIADAKNVDYSSLQSAFPDSTIVVIGDHRFPKFMREFPQAKHFLSVARAEVKAAEEALTESDKRILGADYYAIRKAEVFDASKIDDPEVANFVTLMKGTRNSANIARFNAAVNSLKKLGYGYSAAVTTFRTPFEKYPLISSNNIAIADMQHAYLYMNAVYAAIYKEKK